MKRGACVLAVLVLAAWVSIGAEEPAGAVEKALLMVRVGNVDEALMGRLHDWAQRNLMLPVRMLTPLEVTADTLDGLADDLEKLMNPDDVALVAVVAPTNDLPAHGLSLPGRRIALVNAAALRKDDPDPERYGRRLDRMVMRGFGFLLGMVPCPNPQCALWQYTNNDELDSIGRNFCPPCQDRTLAAAGAHGIRVCYEAARELEPPPIEPAPPAGTPPPSE